MNASRAILKDIDKNHSVFPFATRAFDEGKIKLAMRECRDHALVHSYPVLMEKEGEFVAQVKFTVIITNFKTERITGRELPVKGVTSTYQLEDEEIRKLLTVPIFASKSAAEINRAKKKKAKAAAKKSAESTSAAPAE